LEFPNSTPSRVLPQEGRPESFSGPCRCADGAAHPQRPSLRWRPPLLAFLSPWPVLVTESRTLAIRRGAASHACCRRNSGSKGVTVSLHSCSWALPVPVRHRAPRGGAYRLQFRAEQPLREPSPTSSAGLLACRPVTSRAAAAAVPSAEPAARRRAVISITGGLPPLGRTHPEPQPILHTNRG
jgi:hypothetical protein